MKNIRIYFKKQGRIKYISHLDINRCIQRAIKRSGLPVWFTEGFNPHVYLSFALPLSLGFESECESFDIRLIEDIENEVVVDKLNSVLPDGLIIYDIAEPIMKPEKIAYANYDIAMVFENSDINKIAELFSEFLSQDNIIVTKKSKKGEKEIDLKPLFKISNLTNYNNIISFKITIASGNTLNINPTLLIDAFCSKNNVMYSNYKIMRTAILTEDMQNFR